ncbi:MAG: hypothetical protein ACI9G9_001155 [Psychromonas sp.]|jgi:hypothetical protein
MRLLFILIVAGSLFSCEKVIDLKLRSSEAKYVIKAEVNAGDSIHFVRITKSIPFDQENVFPNVTDAVVALSDNQGNSEVLLSIGNGVYRTDNFKAFDEVQYTVEVKHQDKVFVATSIIPKTVNLDEVIATESEFFGQTSFVLTPRFLDLAGIRNYYGFVYSKVTVDFSKQASSNLILRDDEFSDGQYNQQPLFGNYAPQAGDTVEVIMIGLDESAFEFYFSKETNTSPDSGAPANPVSNWSNGALGYFTAQNLQKRTIEIPE